MSVQCALPVTGSSAMPTPGAKKRETKSASLPRAVAMMPRQSSDASCGRSGVSVRTSSSLPRSARKSRLLRTSRGMWPRPLTSPAGAAHGTPGREGKSIITTPFSKVAPSSPLVVLKFTAVPVCPSSVKITNAAASVAWPHRSTSTVGVNQRSSQLSLVSPLPTRNAVSERLFSSAICWSTASGIQPSSRHTPAGLPLKARSVNASTWK